MKVRKATKSDWPKIKKIYQLGINTEIATFESQTPKDFETWISKLDKENTFVCEKNNLVLGWVALSKVSSRATYKGVGEISIYVDPNYHNKKVGETLYTKLEDSALETGYWTIQAQLFTANKASKAFFKKQEFRQVGVRKKIGNLNGEWIDNFLYEKNFN